MKARTIPIPESKKVEGYYSDDPCIICGREVKNPRYWVHLVGGGAELLHLDDEDLYVDDGGDMYFHPVGSECAKRVPKGYLDKGNK